MIKRVIGILAVVLALGLAVFSSQWGHPQAKVSGFIEANEMRIGSRVGGRVQSVSVQEGATVTKGDALVKLEPFDLLERRAEAQAMLDAKKAVLARLVAGPRVEDIAQAQARRDQLSAKLAKLKAGPRKQEIAAAQAQAAAAEAQLELAQLTLNRVRSSFLKNAASQDELDRAMTLQRVAAATLTARQQELELLNVGTRPEDIAEAEAQLAEAQQALQLLKNGYRTEEIDEARAAVAAAAAALAAIARQVDELEITAPSAGVVEAVDLEPGDLVAPNQPVLSMLDTSKLWVRAYVPENRLDVQLDQKVQVTVDSYPGRSFAAHISFIATQAEFTPRNIQTPEERSKQVFRIKVTLDEGRDVLRAGMAADVHLKPAAPPQ